MSGVGEVIGWLGSFRGDPVGFVENMFPWGRGELAGRAGPEPWQRGLLQIDQYPGMYTQSRMRIDVTALPGNKLCLAIRTHESADGPPQTLRPAQNYLFIPESRDHPELPFVQFVKSPGSDHFDYLWNGKQLWRRD